MAQVTDPLGLVTNYTYDNVGREPATITRRLARDIPGASPRIDTVAGQPVHDPLSPFWWNA